MIRPIKLELPLCSMSCFSNQLIGLCLVGMLTGCGAGTLDDSNQDPKNQTDPIKTSEANSQNQPILPEQGEVNSQNQPIQPESGETNSQNQSNLPEPEEANSQNQSILPELGEANSVTENSENSQTDAESIETVQQSLEVASEIQEQIQESNEPPELVLDPPTISDVLISLVTEDSAEVRWSLDQPATGVIEYGETPQFDLANSPEDTFKYSAHRQPLRNLSSGTKYYFQIISANESGIEARSEVFSFTTTASSEITSSESQATSQTGETQVSEIGTVATSEGWPEVFNDSLPLAGIFYGNHKAGLATGNGPLVAQNAIRFRAERTGMVNAIRYNNRRILPTDIADRCDFYGPGSVWCVCEDNNLDSWSCGYTLSNAYHVGSGGLITIELRSDDGTSNHQPSSTVLGYTETYQPAEMSAKFPTLALNQPVQVHAGQIYHIVFRNDKPPTCRVRALSVQEAAACPRGEGAIGMNGTKHSSDESDGSRFGPMLGDISGRILYRSDMTSPWRVSSDVIAFYEVRYTDNEYVGNTYTGLRNFLYSESVGGSRVIEGDIIARQYFTVEDATRNVDGLWLHYGHAYDRPANGNSLAVTLKDADENTIASTTLPASQACSTRAQEGAAGNPVRATRDEWMCRKWGYSEFSQTISLLEGSSYILEFSAPQGAAFALSSYFSTHRMPERNMWDNAHAEISRNGGATWELWTGNDFPTRDLPVLFTIEGMPKQLP